MKRFFKLDLDYNSRNHFRGIANYYEDLLYEKNIFIVDYFDKSTTVICSYNIFNIYPIRHVTLGSFVFDFYGYRYNEITPYLFLDLHREYILEALKSHLVYIKRKYIK